MPRYSTNVKSHAFALENIDAYVKIFDRHNVHLSTYFINYDYEKTITEMSFVVLAPSHRNYLPMFEDLRLQGNTLSLTLSSQS